MPKESRAKASRRFIRHCEAINQFADREGWALFNFDELEHDAELQRDDTAAVFQDDEAAIAHCQKLADQGSALHKEALAIHRKEWT